MKDSIFLQVTVSISNAATIVYFLSLSIWAICKGLFAAGNVLGLFPGHTATEDPGHCAKINQWWLELTPLWGRDLFLASFLNQTLLPKCQSSCQFLAVMHTGSFLLFLMCLYRGERIHHGPVAVTNIWLCDTLLLSSSGWIQESSGTLQGPVSGGNTLCQE